MFMAAPQLALQVGIRGDRGSCGAAQGPLVRAAVRGSAAAHLLDGHPRLEAREVGCREADPMPVHGGVGEGLVRLGGARHDVGHRDFDGVNVHVARRLRADAGDFVAAGAAAAARITGAAATCAGVPSTATVAAGSARAAAATGAAAAAAPAAATVSARTTVAAAAAPPFPPFPPEPPLPLVEPEPPDPPSRPSPSWSPPPPALVVPVVVVVPLPPEPPLPVLVVPVVVLPEPDPPEPPERSLPRRRRVITAAVEDRRCERAHRDYQELFAGKKYFVRVHMEFSNAERCRWAYVVFS